MVHSNRLVLLGADRLDVVRQVCICEVPDDFGHNGLALDSPIVDGLAQVRQCTAIGSPDVLRVQARLGHNEVAIGWARRQGVSGKAQY